MREQSRRARSNASLTFRMESGTILFCYGGAGGSAAAKGVVTMPSISVIVPVYQAEAYVQDCVESVRAQTFADWELLLVDDGSKDASPALCDQLAAADGRIRVFHKPNGGVSSARNLGLREAAGAYAAFWMWMTGWSRRLWKRSGACGRPRERILRAVPTKKSAAGVDRVRNCCCPAASMASVRSGSGSCIRCWETG